MSKICPETKEKVLYLTCLECEDRFSCGKSTDSETENEDENKKKKED